ncbi:alpha/beta fold hydrolase [Candidatus Neomarinimicrobiota bacterium]
MASKATAAPTPAWEDVSAPGTTIEVDMVAVAESVSLRVTTFSPAVPSSNPTVIFISGWISQVHSWEHALRDMTRDFTVHYVDTREKATSRIRGKTEYGVEAVARDIVQIVSHFGLKSGKYIIIGSSLGATAGIDALRMLPAYPRCLALVGTNATFRVPLWGRILVTLFPPRLYLIIKPFIKWYLRHFRLDPEHGLIQHQKYSQNLDAADPWKLRKACLALAAYAVWDYLPLVNVPTLVFGASRDTLHDPGNIHKIVAGIEGSIYLDLETNERTHSAEMVVELRKFLAGI